MRDTLGSGWRPALALALLGAAPAGADVRTVDASGSGDFVEIQPALDASRHGDLVLVRTGSYAGFTVDSLGVAVVEDAGAEVTVSGQVRVVATPPGRTVLLDGLTIEAVHTGADWLLDALVLTTTQGAVRVQGCELRGADGMDYSRAESGGDALRATDAADVSLVRCHLVGGAGAMSFSGFADNRGGDGLSAEYSHVALHDSLLTGGDGGPGDFLGCDYGGDGGHGARLFESFVYASATRALGGDGGGDDFFACRPGGHGIYLVGAGTDGHLVDLLLEGGAGACGAPDGLPVSTEGGATVDPIPGLARRFRAPSPVREGATVELHLSGVPGERAYVLVADEPDFAWLPSLDGALLLQLPLSQGRRFLGLVPPSGVLTKRVPIPGLPPAAESATLYVQALFHDPGNGARLGGPATLVVLDGSL